MYQLTVEGHFDSAHSLPAYNGPCHNVHGHRWLVKATFNFAELDREQGMACDFKVLKTQLDDILDLYDHRLLNLFLDCPTAENLSRTIYEVMNHPNLYSITVFETPDTQVMYIADGETCDPGMDIIAHTGKQVVELNAVLNNTGGMITEAKRRSYYEKRYAQQHPKLTVKQPVIENPYLDPAYKQILDDAVTTENTVQEVDEIIVEDPQAKPKRSAFNEMMDRAIELQEAADANAPSE